MRANRTTDRSKRRPDDAIVEQARAGDAAAFEVLVLRHRSEVFRLAVRMAPNRADAEEILQETFLQAFRAIGDYRRDASFRTWLYRIALSVALMHRRAARRRPTEPLQAGHAPLDDASPPVARSGEEEPSRADDLLERKELARTVHDALESLDGAYRPVVLLRDLEERSSHDAARELGVSSDVVRQRLRRAHLMLRERLARTGRSRRASWFSAPPSAS